MSEWFYIQQWNVNQRKIWTVIDEDLNLYTEDLLSRYSAERLVQHLKNTNKASYRVIHNMSQEYTRAIENKEVKNEN